MNSAQFNVLKTGANLKVGKNQIFFDGEFFVVEQFEWVENGQDMFSVLDAFMDFEEAYNAALDPQKYIKKLMTQ